MWNNPELLGYIAMCVRMKLKKDEDSKVQDEKVQARIERGEIILREIRLRIKELQEEK